MLNRYLRIDGDKPTISITQSLSTSSSSPTIVTSSSYTVSGTASDGSGIKSVTVNGTSAGTTSWSRTITLTKNTTTTVTIVATDNSGRTTTVTRYVRYYSATTLSPSTTYYYNAKDNTATTSADSFSGGYSSYTYGGIVYDLGSAKRLENIKIVWAKYAGWGSAPGNNDTLKIYGSNSFSTSNVTSQSWTQLGSGTISINYDSVSTQTFSVSNTELYRYIRIYMPACYKDVNSVSYYWSRIGEIGITLTGG
jgi:hypothetical protein